MYRLSLLLLLVLINVYSKPAFSQENRSLSIRLIPAPAEKKQVIQNLSRFYGYDVYRACAYEEHWSFPATGMLPTYPIDAYWKEPNHFPFTIEVNGELGGFVLINKTGSSTDSDWNMAEFFIAGKFQHKGIGRQVAFKIFEQFQGNFEIMALPCNKPAVSFWKKTVSSYTQGQYIEERKNVHSRNPQDTVIFKFKSKNTVY